MGKRKDKKGGGKKVPEEVRNLEQGRALIAQHPLFSRLEGYICLEGNGQLGKKTAAITQMREKRGFLYLNQHFLQQPLEWAYTIAHCLLHLAFGHFDAENLPGFWDEDGKGRKIWHVSCDKVLWNIACDIYITKFLRDIKFGKTNVPMIEAYYTGPLVDERTIYEHLAAAHFPPDCHIFGTGAPDRMDMDGLDQPAVYEKNEKNEYTTRFAFALAQSVTDAVSEAAGGGRSIRPSNQAEQAASWFMGHYPLLGALASGFKIIYDTAVCHRYDISIAAVDVTVAEVYVNPAAGLSPGELRFVLAHEYLHAGLQHHERCQGRDPYLWNVACDFVINGWLKQMQVGEVPQRGILLDAQFDNVSAEEVYDRIVSDLKTYAKLDTLRGYGKGDLVGGSGRGFRQASGNMDLDEFYRSALQNGLEYHKADGRGLVPYGLEQEIRALSLPPVPWDVKLAQWFDLHFALAERHRSFARPSRRQGSTPDIPRPRLVPAQSLEYDRTFGVVIDTSGSMSAKQIGYALGAVASYAASKEVPYARVVFCDADAYDAGYLAPEDIAGRVRVKGRGGTVLQPGVDLLLDAKDFPKDGPILIITDGWIEEHLSLGGREHAYILPAGRRLPFRPKGEVFYVKELK